MQCLASQPNHIGREKYEYTPLETPSTIRLAILPRHDGVPENEDVSIQMLHVDISEVSKKYTALSYFWGDESDLKTIFINEKTHHVTRNLDFFLRRRRREPENSRLRNQNQYFWVDALCINQADLTEKAIQLPLMRRIYEGALYVHAELGPANEVESKAMQMMRENYEYMIKIWSDSDCPHQYSGYDAVFTNPTYLDFWAGMTSILARPWWRRVWVMQEASATRNVLINCGNNMVEFTYMEGKLPTIVMSMMSRGVDIGCEVPLLSLTRIMRLQHSSGPGGIHLWDILQLFRSLECTLEHDRIYAAINLTKRIPSELITIDYGKPILEVYQQAAKYCVEAIYHLLDILSECCDFKEPDPSRPSWIPQWDRVLENLCLRRFCGTRDSRLPRRTYNILGRPTEVSELDTAITLPRVQGMSLHVRATFIHPIKTINPVHLRRPSETEIFSLLSAWIPNGQDQMYVSGKETKMDAFLRTIVMDLTHKAAAKDFEDLVRGGKATWNFKNNRLAAAEGDWDHKLIRWACQGRSFATTAKGYFALLPWYTRMGDRIAALDSGWVFHILRPVPDQDAYRFIGECYVHSLMDGELLQWEDLPAKEEIRII